MRVVEPIRVQVRHFLPSFGFGRVISSEYPQIPVGALAFTFPTRRRNVFTPVILSTNGQLYSADYSPLRAREEEVERMYFIRHRVTWWSSEDAEPGRTV